MTALRCFFRDVRGAGICEGDVVLPDAEGRSYPMMTATDGYCAHHREANLSRGFWGAKVKSMRSRTKARLDAIEQALKAA